jgi:hypothetical protein
VSHALPVVNRVPYSQLALCTTLGNTPYRVDFLVSLMMKLAIETKDLTRGVKVVILKMLKFVRACFYTKSKAFFVVK